MQYGKASQIEFLFKNENWTTQLVYDKDPLFDELKEVQEGELEFRMVKGWKDYYLKLITLTSNVIFFINLLLYFNYLFILSLKEKTIIINI